MVMRTALIWALMVSPALAGVEDDYVACLVGQSAVALHSQQSKDALAAQQAALKLCPEPKGTGEDEMEGLLDYVNLMVERMAAE